MIVEKNSLNQPLKPPFSEQAVGDLLISGQYEQAAEVIYKAQVATERAANTDVSQLLAAARLMCLTAGQNYLEMEWHQWAAQEAEKRRIESIQRLCDLLERVDFLLSSQRRSATELTGIIVSHPASPPSANGVHSMPDHSVWRTIIKLLKRGISVSPTLPQSLSTSQPEIPTAAEDATTPETQPRAENELVVYTLGTFQVYRNDELIENWPSRKGVLILKYLLLNRGRPVHKEILMDLLWPDSEEEAQRNNLNVAVYSLRQVLRNSDSTFSHILFQNDSYFLNQDQDIWTDYEAFSEHFKLAKQQEQQGDQWAAIQQYIGAEALYDGPFLPDDCYEVWTESQRQSLQAAYLSVLDRLSDHYLQVGDYPACITICHKMLAADSCLEDAHVRLMRCYSRQGQHFLALRQYDRCAKVLEAELEVAPMSETAALHELIRAGERI